MICLSYVSVTDLYLCRLSYYSTDISDNVRNIFQNFFRNILHARKFLHFFIEPAAACSHCKCCRTKSDAAHQQEHCCGKCDFSSVFSCHPAPSRKNFMKCFSCHPDQNRKHFQIKPYAQKCHKNPNGKADTSKAEGHQTAKWVYQTASRLRKQY